MFKIKIPLWRQSALWGIALPGLIALNLMRDVSTSNLIYRWSPVKRETFHSTLTVKGTFEAATILNMKATQDGAVENIFVQEGQTVRAGQVLIEFSRTQALLETQQKNAQCKTIEAEIHKTRKRLETQKKLLRNGAISPSYIDETTRSIESLKEKFNAAEALRLSSQKKLEELRVRAPFAGTILSVTAQPAAVMMTGEPLLVIADNSKFIFRTKVDDKNIRKTALGQIVQITTDAGDSQPMKGTVKSIGAQGMVVIDIVDAKKNPLWRNNSGQAVFRFEDIPNVLAAPMQAVIKNENGQTFIVVRNKWGWVRQRRVTLGRTSEESVQVLKGLEDGESVGVLSIDMTEAGADATTAGGDSASMDSSSSSKNRSSRDHSLINNP